MRNVSVMQSKCKASSIMAMAFELVQLMEDDVAQAALLDHVLRAAGYRTNVAPDGELGLEDVKRLRPALILLDVMLPGLDGYEVCRRIRQDPEIARTPIIMLSALGGHAEQREEGFRIGVDDYIAKPFSPKEVVARVGAMLRRRLHDLREPSSPGDPTVVEMVVRYRGKQFNVTREEWRILQYLADASGQIATDEELAGYVWGEDGLLHDRELERLASSLSQKLNQEPMRQVVLKLPGGTYRLFPSF
ncbi:response regulator transcription factor [Candidatus Nitrospira bockiana]